MPAAGSSWCMHLMTVANPGSMLGHPDPCSGRRSSAVPQVQRVALTLQHWKCISLDMLIARFVAAGTASSYSQGARPSQCPQACISLGASGYSVPTTTSSSRAWLTAVRCRLSPSNHLDMHFGLAGCTAPSIISALCLHGLQSRHMQGARWGVPVQLTRGLSVITINTGVDVSAGRVTKAFEMIPRHAPCRSRALQMQMRLPS